jgi:Bacterial Ig domain
MKMVCRKNKLLLLCLLSFTLCFIACDTDTPPVVTITSPDNGAEFEVGSDVAFTGTATDEPDGELSGSSLVWSATIDDAVIELGTGTSVTHQFIAAGEYLISLDATDSGGSPGADDIGITITSNSGEATPA